MTWFPEQTHFTHSVPRSSFKVHCILWTAPSFTEGSLGQPPVSVLQISAMALEVSGEQTWKLTASLKAQLNPKIQPQNPTPPPKKKAHIHAPQVKNDFERCVIRQRKHLNKSALETRRRGSVQILRVNFGQQTEVDAHAGPHNLTSKYMDHYGNRKILISESVGDLRGRNERLKTLAQVWHRWLDRGKQKNK